MSRRIWQAKMDYVKVSIFQIYFSSNSCSKKGDGRGQPEYSIVLFRNQQKMLPSPLRSANEFKSKRQDKKDMMRTGSNPGQVQRIEACVARNGNQKVSYSTEPVKENQTQNMIPRSKDEKWGKKAAGTVLI